MTIPAMELSMQDIEAKRRGAYAKVYEAIGQEAKLDGILQKGDPRVQQLPPHLLVKLSQQLTEVNASLG